MVTLDEVLKKQKQQQQTQQGTQQTQQDQNTQTLREKLMGGNSNISAAKTLEDSLKDVEHTTALSKEHIKESWNKASNFFGNIWHTITDKDEDKGILDYSDYKQYKEYLDTTTTPEQKEFLYQQMSDEGVIDYNKFKQWQSSDNAIDKYEKYDTALDNIKKDFDKRLTDAFSPYMKGVEGSYQLNAVTKAKQELYDQYAMFVDGYATTYKNTRDGDLLKDFDKILSDYENDIIKFGSKWADNLTSKDEGGLVAYYDTLNDAGMKEYAKDIRSIQYKASNAMSKAALRSNFGDAADAFSDGKLISGVAECIGGVMNVVNWGLDQIGAGIEGVKNSTLGWYDVVEELANLNVYSNDASFLQKTFGSLASWGGEIVDGLPTLAPMVAEWILTKKAGLRAANGANISKAATKIDDIIGVIYRNKNNAKNIAKAGDIILNKEMASNLGRFGIKMLSEGIEDIFLYDVAFQQFEGRPLSDDDLIFNFAANLPINTIISLLPQGAKILAKGLDNEVDLMSNVMDEKIYKVLRKHYEANKKVIEAGMKGDATNEAKAALENVSKVGQEKYYGLKSMELRSGKTPTKTVDISTIGDEGLINFIKKVQEESKGVYDRLTTFGASLDDYLMEMQAQLGSKAMRNLPADTVADEYVRQVKAKSELIQAMFNQVKAKSNLLYISAKLANLGKQGIDWLDEALEKGLPGDTAFKKLIREMLVPTTKENLINTIKEAKAIGEDTMSAMSISDGIEQVVSALIEKHPHLIEEKEIISGFIKENEGGQEVFRNLLTGQKLLTVADLVQYIRGAGGKGVLTVDSSNIFATKEGLTKLLGDIDTNKLKAVNIVGEEIQGASSVVKEGANTFYDVTEYLADTGGRRLPGINPLWKGNNWNSLLNNDASAMIVNDIYKKKGLNIVGRQDGSFTITATRDAVDKLVNDVNKLIDWDQSKQLTSGNKDTIKFLFASDYQADIATNVKAINLDRTNRGLPTLTAKELKQYSKEHKFYIDSAFLEPKDNLKEINKLKKEKGLDVTVDSTRAEAAQKANATKKGEPAKDVELESVLDEEGTKEVKEAIKDLKNGNKSVKETEQIAAKWQNKKNIQKTIDEELQKIMNQESEADLYKILKLNLKNSFVGHWAIQEGDIDEGLVDKVCDRFVGIITMLIDDKGLSVGKGDYLLNAISDALGYIQVTPMTMALINGDAGLDNMIYSLMATVISKSPENTAAFYNVLQNNLTKIFKDQGTIGKIKARDAASDIIIWAGNIMSKIREGKFTDLPDNVMTAFEAKTASILQSYGNMADVYDTFRKVMQYKSTATDAFKKGNYLIINDISKRTYEELEKIGEALGYEQIKVNGIYSSELLNNAIKGYTDGLKTLKDKYAKGGKIVKIEIKPDLSPAFQHSGKDEFIDIGCAHLPSIMGGLTDSTIFKNILLHEYNHALGWNKQSLLKRMEKAQSIKDTNLRLKETAYLKAQYDVLQEFGGSYVDYALGLKDRLGKILKNAVKNGNTDSIFMSNYIKGNLNENLDEIISNFDKDTLINKLVNLYEDVHNVDAYKPQDFAQRTKMREELFGYNDNMYFEEWLNDLQTLSELGLVSTAGLKEVVDVTKLNKAIELMQDSAEVIDRFRYIVQKNGRIDANELKQQLSLVFDTYSIGKNDKLSSNVADVLYDIVGKGGDLDKSAANIRRTLRQYAQLGDKGINTNPEALRKNITSGLSYILSNEKALAKSGLTKEQAELLLDSVRNSDDTELYLTLDLLDIYEFIPSNKSTLTIEEKGLSHIRDVEYSNIGETALDKQLGESLGEVSEDSFGNIVTTKTKHYGQEGEVIEGGRLVKPKNAKVTYETNVNIIKGQKKTLENNKKVVNTIIKEGKIGREVPLMYSIASMGYDLGKYGTRITSLLSKIVGDTGSNIDRLKLIVGDETLKAYDYALKHGFKGSRSQFILNRLVANVLGVQGKYSQEAIDIINRELRDGQYDAAISSIIGSNQYNAKYFVDMFNSLLDNYKVEKGKGKLIEKEVSKEPLLTRKQWEEAYKEWLDSKGNTQTIDRYFNFDRKGYFFEKKGNKKIRVDYDLSNYDDYVKYYNYWGKQKVYGEWIEGNVSVDDVLKYVSTEDMKEFNKYMADYLRAIRNGSDAEQEAKKLSNKLYSIIEDTGSANHANYRLKSVIERTPDDYVDLYETEEMSMFDDIQELIERQQAGLDITQEESELIDAYKNWDGDSDFVGGYKLDNFGGDVNASSVSDDGGAIRNSIENYLENNNETFIDPYKLQFNSSMFQITEKGDSELSKSLSVNLGTYYNASTKKGRTTINKLADKNLNVKKGEEVDRYSMWNRIKSFENGTFNTGDPISYGNVMGVSSLFGKSIGNKAIDSIQIVFKNGESMLYSKAEGKIAKSLDGQFKVDNGKAIVQYSQGANTEGLINTIADSFLNVKEGGLAGAEIRYLDNEGEVIEQSFIDKNNFWKSFAGAQVLENLGIQQGGIDLSMTDSAQLYKSLGLIGGNEDKVKYRDILDVAKGLGVQDFAGNNLQTFEKISAQLSNKIRATLIDIQVLKNADEEYTEEIGKLYDRLDNLYDLQERINNGIINNGGNPEQEIETLVDKIKQLRINAEIALYNKDGTPFKKGVPVTYVKDGKKVSEISGQYDAQVKKIYIYPNGNTKVTYENAFEKVEGKDGKDRWIMHRNEYVYVDDNGVPTGKTEPIVNYYQVTSIKPKIDVYDTSDVVTTNLAKEGIEVIEDNIPDGRLIKSFFLDGNKKGGGIALDNTNNINGDAFYDIVDRKIIEEELGTVPGAKFVVNKTDKEYMIVMENKQGLTFNAMLKQVDVIDKATGKHYPDYLLYFNSDAEIGNALLKKGEAYDFRQRWLGKGEKPDVEYSLEDNVFVNGDDLLKYDYVMPLHYSQSKKVYSDQLMSELPEEEKNKYRSSGWKDNHRVGTYMFDINKGEDTYRPGELMTDANYEKEMNLVKQREEQALKDMEDEVRKGDTYIEREPTVDVNNFSLKNTYEEYNKTTITDTEELLANDDAEIKELIKENANKKKVAKGIDKIANADISYKMMTASELQADIFSHTNYDILGGSTVLSQLRGENADFKRIYGDRLRTEVERLLNGISGLNEAEKKVFFERIRKVTRESKKDTIRAIFDGKPSELNEAQDALNKIASIFADAGWNNTTILHGIRNENSANNLLYNTFNTYLNVSLGKFNTLRSADDVRKFVFDTSRGVGASSKRAMNLAKDWVGDPLGTGALMKFLANVRSAYRFAKYSILSPVSGTLMLLNSTALSEPLLAGKKKGLNMYFDNASFKALMEEEGVTNWLERDEDILFNAANGMQMGEVFVDKMLNKIANSLTPKGTKINKTLRVIMTGGEHSLYDMYRSGAVREYAFAQALKQNGIKTEQALDDLLNIIRNGDINKTEYITRWRSIMADTEENYARFFSNANTTALSRHRWSRAFGFNFLQGYVINRTDEMLQGIKKLYNYVKDAGVKNLTWDDITRHLAEDNVEMKSFMNNILLTAKLGYYLDRAGDADGTEGDNVREYFINTNDYLSSLDTVWFMRLFSAIPEGLSEYKDYIDMTDGDFNMIEGVEVGAFKLASEICSQFFREGKFLNAMMQTIVSAMQTGDLNFAATVAGVEREKMANGLGRFGLKEGLEKYGLEDFSEPSDIIGQVLLASNKTSITGKIQDKLYALSNVDKIISDPGYAAVTTLGYLPIVGELLKTATGKGGFNFNEAKYKEMMNMVEHDKGLQELYSGHINAEVYSDQSINRLWNDFISFNYPTKYEKTAGIHSVGSFIDGRDTTLNSMKEDVFVQNICENMGITVEELHNMISADSAKKTGLLKIMAAAEAAEPGSGKIILSYKMASDLYKLEQQVTGKQYPTTADLGEEAMLELKKMVIDMDGDLMFTADKTSWYKAIREYISNVNPEVFDTLYKNDQLTSYLGSIGFMDMLMRDAAQKGDMDAKYFKNLWGTFTKYFTNDDARIKAFEYLCGQANKLNLSSSTRQATMEGMLAANIDFYNRLKNSPILSNLYGDALDDFEHRLWGTLDKVDIVDDSYKRQNYSKGYTPYTSQYGDNNKKVEDELTNKANKYFPKSSGSGNGTGYYNPYSYTTGSSVKPKDDLDWYRKYYEGLIKDYSDRLVKSEGKKYPAQTIEGMTFKTGSNNRGSIKGQQLSFQKHKSKQYRTNVLSNLPGSHG